MSAKKYADRVCNAAGVGESGSGGACVVLLPVVMITESVQLSMSNCLYSGNVIAKMCGVVTVSSVKCSHSCAWRCNIVCKH